MYFWATIVQKRWHALLNAWDQGYVRLICLITGEVTFLHLVKILPLLKLLFSFWNEQVYCGKYLQTMQTSCFSSYVYPLILASMDAKLGQPNSDFLF